MTQSIKDFSLRSLAVSLCFASIFFGLCTSISAFELSKIAVGEQLVVKRVSNASEGTSYEVEFDPQLLELISTQAEYQGRRGECGAATNQSWTFTGKNSGVGKILVKLFFRGALEKREELPVEVFVKETTEAKIDRCKAEMRTKLDLIEARFDGSVRSMRQRDREIERVMQEYQRCIAD